MPMQGSLSIERMCQLAGVSRAGFYRSLQERAPVEEEMETRSAIQEIAVEHRRRYGYRRITAELRRRGMRVNHKRVLRILREDNLLGVQPRAFVVTTNTEHWLEVYLNLARPHEADWNQSVMGRGPYLYPAAPGVCLLGGSPGRVLPQGGGMGAGTAPWRSVAIAALQQAIAGRQPPPGLVHHSDRGVQYACGDYGKVLQPTQMIASMSRPANPYDNASCESFLKTFKREEIYANEYATWNICSRTSKHSSNSIQSLPLAFGAGLSVAGRVQREASTTVNSAGATLSFFRHGRSISPMREAKLAGATQQPPPGSSSR